MFDRVIKSKYYRIIDILFMILVFSISLWFIFNLTYRQATAIQGWESDIGHYINKVIDKDYGCYPIMFWTAAALYKLWGGRFTPQFVMALTVTLFNLISFFITKSIISKQTNTKIIATISTVVLYFSSMIFNHRLTRFGIKYYFEGVGSQNPWHNATYTCARPFVILAFIFGAYTLLHYEEDFRKDKVFSWAKYKYYIYFAIILFLSTLAKPSYTLPHMFVVFIVAVFRFFKNKCKTFRQSIILATTYIPTICALVYQYLYELTGTDNYGNEQGLGIKLGGSWAMYSDNIPLAIILAAFFPFVVLIIHRNELKQSQQYRFAWQLYIAGLIMRLIIMEQGYRAGHDNFCWGYYYGILLVFFTSIIITIKDCRNMFCENKAKNALLIVATEVISLFVHFIFGVHFFYLLYIGYDYHM